MVPLYLAPFGYSASGPEDWRSVPGKSLRRPTLGLAIDGHSEGRSHTLYSLRCSLALEEPALLLEWRAPRRLAQLRDGLHSLVKGELGKAYNAAFAEAPFAKRGGPAGTTERLHAWVEALANCVNAGTASPALVAQVLLFLETPAQAEHVTTASTVEDKLEDEESEESSRAGVVSPSAAGRGGDAGQQAAGAPLAEPQATALLTRPPEVPQTSSPEESKPSATRDVSRPASEIESNEATPRRMEDSGKEPLPPAAGTGGSGECVEEKSPVKAAAKDLQASKAVSQPVYSSEEEKILAPFGYQVAGPKAWRGSGIMPRLRLSLSGHEKGSQTRYVIKCQLSAARPAEELEWLVHRTLVELRTELHEIVKGELGKDYAVQFAGVPFANRTGPPGTSKRLQQWLETLAACVNARLASPALAAHVFCFLEAPSRHCQDQLEGNPRADQEATLPVGRSASPLEASTAPCPRTTRRRTPLGRRTSSETNNSVEESGNTTDEDSSTSLERRMAGYKRLRKWFVELKRVWEKKAAPAQHSLRNLVR